MLRGRQRYLCPLVLFAITAAPLAAGAQTTPVVNVLANVSEPFGGVVLASDGAVYGTSRTGGSVGCGYVYRLARGATPTILHEFTGTDGCQPHGELVEGADGALYGTTFAGGPHVDAQATAGTGTVFRISPTGTHSMLHAFAPIAGGVHPEGWAPMAGLVVGPDGNLYGTTSSGGTGVGGPFTFGPGTAFRVTTAGVLTVLHQFSITVDGARPVGGLTLATDGNFYGTILVVDPMLGGALYRLTPTGQYSRVFGFPWTGCGAPSCFPLGANPAAAPTQVGSDLYVLGRDYGAGERGTVVRVTPDATPDGVGLLIHAFSGADGATPERAMTLGSDGHLYGVTRDGGVNNGSGTIFRIANGSLTKLHDFGFPGGSSPQGRLLEVAPGVFLGTTASGGTSAGTIFRLSLITPVAPTASNDAYSTPFRTPLLLGAPGILANDISNGGGAMTTTIVNTVSHGVLEPGPDGGFTYTPDAGFAGVDSFTYRAVDWFGQSNIATVTITVINPTALQPPTGLYVSSLIGNLLTVRWNPALAGPDATGYVLEGGINPGQVLGSLNTGTPYPIFTFAAPTGAFYIRVHAVNGAERSGPSNEIRVFVRVPQAPSAPDGLVGVVSGSSLGLTWRNTFAGGAPNSIVLDVTGSFTGSIFLGLVDRFTVPAVPGGTYTFSVRARNGVGTSASSNLITLTLPGACSGAPEAPPNFLAYKSGSRLSLVWDPATTGPAPTTYIVKATGTVTGSLPTTARSMSANVPPGTYNLSVTAVNACGSAITPVQTIVVP